MSFKLTWKQLAFYWNVSTHQTVFVACSFNAYSIVNSIFSVYGVSSVSDVCSTINEQFEQLAHRSWHVGPSCIVWTVFLRRIKMNIIDRVGTQACVVWSAFRIHCLWPTDFTHKSNTICTSARPARLTTFQLETSQTIHLIRDYSL